MWYWKYEADDGSTHSLYYTIGQQIRIRVIAIEFTNDKTTNNTYLPPMIVHVRSSIV